MPALQTSIFGQMSLTATDPYHKLQCLLPATSLYCHTLPSLKLTQLSLPSSRFEGCQDPWLHNNQLFSLSSFCGFPSVAWEAKMVLQVLPRVLALNLQGIWLGNMPHSCELTSRKGLREASQKAFFYKVLIFNEFSTADENFLSSSINCTKM